jgi:hypothetical protein
MAAKARHRVRHLVAVSPRGGHHQHVKRMAAGVSPSGLFTALDGLKFDAARHRWRIEVYSVADRARHRWIQLSLRGRESRMLTLSLATSDGARRIVETLASWMTDPGHKPDMVQAACAWT